MPRGPSEISFPLVFQRGQRNITPKFGQRNIKVPLAFIHSFVLFSLCFSNFLVITRGLMKQPDSSRRGQAQNSDLELQNGWV